MIKVRAKGGAFRKQSCCCGPTGGHRGRVLGQCALRCRLKWCPSQDSCVWLSGQTSSLTRHFHREVSPVASPLGLCPTLLCILSLLIRIIWTRERVGFCIPPNAKGNKWPDKHKDTRRRLTVSPVRGHSGEEWGVRRVWRTRPQLQPAEVMWEPRAQSGQIF